MLSVTAAPSATPLPTYTPYPTAQRAPTSTPFPTFPPRLLPSSTPIPRQQPAATAVSQPTQHPPIAGYVGIPEATGPPLAELEPIVQIIDDSHARCGGWILMQLGVINWGNMPAKKFTVEWSAGVPIEADITRIDDLEWDALPYYFRNKEVQFPCDETTTFTAWVRVDTLNEVPEIYEDNNYKELTFTVPYYPPTRPP